MKAIEEILVKIQEVTERYDKARVAVGDKETELEEYCDETQDLIDNHIDNMTVRKRCRSCGQAITRNDVFAIDEDEVENLPIFKARRDRELELSDEITALEEVSDDAYNMIDSLVSDLQDAINEHPLFKAAAVYVDVWSETL